MMKSVCLKNKGIVLWQAFHFAVVLAFSVCLLCGRRFKINTNLFDILPESSGMKTAGKADRVLGEKTGRQFFILVQSENFESAKNGAQTLLDGLRVADSGRALFENLSLGAGEDDLSEIFEFYYKNRFLFLDKKTVAELDSPGGPEEFAESALEKAYSGFSMMPVEYISGDPFFLTERAVENLIRKISGSGTAMTLNDGVLSTEFEEKTYVMLRGSLTPQGASITNEKSGVKKIYECAQKIKDRNPGLDFIYSGVPFHSYESSSGAQKECTIISVISVIAVILLFLFVFRSALPVVHSVTAVGLSALTALCATLLVFGEIHILCFVFGTTLIGSCLDYSIHFFIRWKADRSLKDGGAIKNKLFKGLLLSCVSTEVCYLLLMFAPFGLLKQSAVFSFVGILSSFLTAVLFYPNNTVLEKKRKPFAAEMKFPRVNFAHARIILVIFAVILAFTAFVFRKNLRIENDLRSFYTMSGKLLDDEILSAKVLNHGSPGWYFIVRGKTMDELLLNEEKFCEKLDGLIEQKKLGSYTACTQFVPSGYSQAASLGTCMRLLLPDLPHDERTGNLAENLYRELGFADEEIEGLLQRLWDEALSVPAGSILPDKKQTAFSRNSNPLPSFAESALSSLWIGEIDGEWFSAVLPQHAEDAQIFRDLCDCQPDVFFADKVNDTGFELDRLTKIMLVLLAAAFAVLVLGMLFFYPRKVVLKIAVVPLMTALSECAVLAALNIPAGFFTVTGIILVFGLGLDYIIYTVESGDRLNRFSVFLSFATTELSFGAIAFSTFMPVHVFGTVVFAGLLTAWISTLLFHQKQPRQS